MSSSDEVVFLQHALDLLPHIVGSPHPRPADTTAPWDQLSKRAQELFQHQTDEYLSDYAVVHHHDCVPLADTYSGGRKYSDSAVDGGTISAATYYMEWWISISSAYQTRDGGGSYIRQAVSELTTQHGVESGIRYVERLWSNRFITHSHTAWENLWALTRAKAYGIEPEQSIEELLAAKDLAGDEAGRPHAIPSLIAEANRKHHRSHGKLIETYHRDRASLERRLKEIKEGADSASAWLSEIRILLPLYKVLQKIAEEATQTATVVSEQDELDTLARYADERHADITTCLRLIRPVGLAGEASQTPRAIEFLYRGRVMFPNTIRQAALSMLEQTGRVDNERLDRHFAATLSEGHRWASDIVHSRLQDVFQEALTSARKEQIEVSEESRRSLVSALLSMGTLQEQEALLRVPARVLEIAAARSVSTAADHLSAVKEAIMGAWAQGQRFALGAMPFVFWSSGGVVATGSVEGPETGLSALASPFTAKATASFRSGAPILARNGPHLALELRPLIAMSDQVTERRAIDVRTAMGIFIAELLKPSRRPHVIWQAWGSIFEGYRTNLALAEHLALCSFLLLPEVFSERECRDLGWFELARMLEN